MTNRTGQHDEQQPSMPFSLSSLHDRTASSRRPAEQRSGIWVEDHGLIRSALSLADIQAWLVTRRIWHDPGARPAGEMSATPTADEPYRCTWAEGTNGFLAWACHSTSMGHPGGACLIAAAVACSWVKAPGARVAGGARSSCTRPPRSNGQPEVPGKHRDHARCWAGDSPVKCQRMPSVPGQEPCRLCKFIRAESRSSVGRNGSRQPESRRNRFSQSPVPCRGTSVALGSQLPRSASRPSAPECYSELSSHSAATGGRSGIGRAIPPPRCDHREHQNGTRQASVDRHPEVLTDVFGRMGEVELDWPTATRPQGLQTAARSPWRAHCPGAARRVAAAPRWRAR